MKYKNKKRTYFLFSLVLIFILPLVTCPLWGQVMQKKHLQAKDYPLFGELKFEKVTHNGKWAAYTMVYQNDIDTLFVQNTSSKKKYWYTTASDARFLANDRFTCQTSSGLKILDLNTSKEITIASVKQYSYLAALEQLVVLRAAGELMLLGRDNKKITEIHGATQFLLSPCEKKILYTTQKDNTRSIGILEPGKPDKTKWIIENSPSHFSMLTWEKAGRSLAFLSTDTSGAAQNFLFYYMLDSNFSYRLDPGKQPGFPADKTIDNQGNYAITISEDLSRVFLGIRESEKQMHHTSDGDSEVEIWNGNAKWIYPMERIMGQFGKRPKLAVWLPFSRAFYPITSETLPKVMLAGEQQYAILSNPQAYEPQFNYDGPRDFYIMDLQTGKKELFLQKQATAPVEGVPMCSPGGKYLVYYKENNWWVYNIAAKTHVNLTGKIGVPFIGKVFNLYISSPYGNPLWTSNDKEIMLYDQYDIWIMQPDGSHFRRITKGREKQIQFRISSFTSPESLTANYNGWTGGAISLTGGLILEARGDDGKTGYFKWENQTGEIPIVYKASRITKLKAVNNAKSFIYQEEQFDQPPKLVLKKDKITTTFFQSNPQQAKYYWGASHLMSYYNSKGEKLKGILYYPAHYDPEKKYPMIVQIYERQSHNLYKYINPALESEDAYNPTALTNEGYFVLCPDIIHEPQNEGLSAVDCTVAATKEIIARGLVFPDKIGIMGHSFGGYETAFIITQTNLFAAAFAGSAITDLSSYYFSVNWNSGRTTMNYFHSESFKMEKSPYEIPEAFTRNSPIVFADKITTPLLSFTGKKDHHVDWYQSVELYLALRRLNKKHILLIYPQEGHSIIDPSSQRDLTRRAHEWFAYYLKDEMPASWIASAVQ